MEGDGAAPSGDWEDCLGPIAQVRVSMELTVRHPQSECTLLYVRCIFSRRKGKNQAHLRSGQPRMGELCARTPWRRAGQVAAAAVASCETLWVRRELTAGQRPPCRWTEGQPRAPMVSTTDRALAAGQALLQVLSVRCVPQSSPQAQESRLVPGVPASHVGGNAALDLSAFLQAFGRD